MPSTINDVAREAGVSATLVSLALSDRPGRSRMSESTYQRIIRAAEKCRYQQNHQARALRAGKTFNVGFYINRADYFNLSEPSLHVVFSSLQRKLWEHQYRLGFYYFDPNQRDGFTEFLTPGRFIDALVVHGRNLTQEEIQQIAVSSIPAVSMFENMTGMHSLTIDEYGAGQAAARYFHEQGYREVSVLGYRTHVKRWDGRYAGFFDEADRIGLLCPPEAQFFAHRGSPVGREREIGRELFENYRASGTKIRALYVPSDYISFGVVEGIRLAGLKLGKDISLLSYDNLEGMENWKGDHPGLSSYAPGYTELGEHAADIIVHHSPGQEPVRKAFPSRLVERKSVTKARSTSARTKNSAK
jgi:DNA-binding LacI/PurR family transcriptional regulator